LSASLEYPPAAQEASRTANEAGRVADSPVTTIDREIHWRRWWSDLVEYRGAFYSLAWRNVRSRYKQALLGMAWALIQPAVQVGVFTLLFGVVAGIPSEGVPYPLFALAGLLPWNFFSKTVVEGSQSLVTSQHIITKLFFPRLYLVVASGASAVLDAVVTSVMLAGFLVHYHIAPTARVWLLPLAVGGIAFFSFGFAALLAAVNARWRDVQHAVPFLVQTALFVTPVIYPVSVIPERWQWAAAINPLTSWIGMFRAGVIGGPWPDTAPLMISVLVSLAVGIFGLWYFSRAERTLVDVV
jgi:lipopolysaccharide transport system permease protein